MDQLERFLDGPWFGRLLTAVTAVLIVHFVTSCMRDAPPKAGYVSLRLDEWRCASVRDEVRKEPIVAGKAVMLLPETVRVCETWTKM